jgi:hypothetical protein
MHVINRDNHEEAADAIRDILMLYVDMADGTAAFGHAASVFIRFDPLKFVDAEVVDDGYSYVDLDLLRAGSAVAILCNLYDLWCEEQSLSGNTYSKRIQLALAEGRLARMPDIEAVLREAILRDEMPVEDPWLEQAVVPIYRKYVLGFFSRLATSDRYAD